MNCVIEEFIDKNYVNNYNEINEVCDAKCESDTIILNLNNRTNCLNYLHNLELKNLKELSLCYNNLFDIRSIKKFKVWKFGNIESNRHKCITKSEF